MFTVLQHVAKKERFKLPDEVAHEISKDSDGNMRKAILVLEALKMQSCAPRLKLVSKPNFYIDQTYLGN